MIVVDDRVWVSRLAIEGEGIEPVAGPGVVELPVHEAEVAPKEVALGIGTPVAEGGVDEGGEAEAGIAGDIGAVVEDGVVLGGGGVGAVDFPPVDEVDEGAAFEEADGGVAVGGEVVLKEEEVFGGFVFAEGLVGKRKVEGVVVGEDDAEVVVAIAGRLAPGGFEAGDGDGEDVLPGKERRLVAHRGREIEGGRKLPVSRSSAKGRRGGSF